jgi:hypothetical protein
MSPKNCMYLVDFSATYENFGHVDGRSEILVMLISVNQGGQQE